MNVRILKILVLILTSSFAKKNAFLFITNPSTMEPANECRLFIRSMEFLVLISCIILGKKVV